VKGFTVIKYVGDDAGEVLCTIIHGGFEVEEPETHTLETRTQMGFTPNPPDDEGEEPDEDGDD